jgi:hypothetical protein
MVPHSLSEPIQSGVQASQKIISENESLDRNIKIEYQKNDDLDDELKVINKIYDRFYVSQKLPNKRKPNKFKTKYYRYIPRNPLMKSDAQKVDIGVELSPDEKKFKKRIEMGYKQRIDDNREKYIRLLNERVKGEPELQEKPSFAQINANPVFKHLGLGYRDNLDSTMISPCLKDIDVTNEDILPIPSNSGN